MQSIRSINSTFGSICIFVAFGGLFIGRMMIYPAAVAKGNFLQRLDSEATAWDYGHRVMLVGAIALIPALLTLWAVIRFQSPRLALSATCLGIFGAALLVGQFALDFAMLAAAQIEPRSAGQAVVDSLQSQPFVELAFYKLPDLLQLGAVLFVIGLWRVGKNWRWPATTATLAVLISLVCPLLWGGLGERIALGAFWIAFSFVAFKIFCIGLPATVQERLNHDGLGVASNNRK